MKGLSLTSTHDLLALFIRRRWWLVWPFVMTSCAVALFTYILPKVYVSDTLILIRPRDVPNDFVRDLVAGTTEQRLSTIEQRVLSRTNLDQILREFEDELPDYQQLNMDDKVQKLRNTIRVTFEVDRRMGTPLPVTYFHVSYQNRSPELAQKIATKLSSLFIEQDSRAREDQVFGTTEFLSTELEKVRLQLQESEDELTKLRSRRRYELPDQLETNLRTLDRLGLDLRSNADTFDRYTMSRLNLEKQLSETPPTLEAPASAKTTKDPIRLLYENYKKVQAEYEALTLVYTPKHPEVQAAEAELERLRAKITPEKLAKFKQEEDADPKVNSARNPVFETVTSQLQGVNFEIRKLEEGKKFLESEVAKYSKRLEDEPEGEEELSKVVRRNTDLNKQYNDLKDHLAQAKLSESLESRQKGSQFQIVDPANLPLETAKPDKSKILLIGTILSLAVGIVIAVAVDIMSQRIWLQSEVESIFGVPVLGEIPSIVTKTDLVAMRRKDRTFAASSVAIAVAYSFALYFAYLNKAYILVKLDPLVQRLMQ